MFMGASVTVVAPAWPGLAGAGVSAPGGVGGSRSVPSAGCCGRGEGGEERQ